jgi:tetratricopeptide (TPR) repeat protein
MIRVLVGILVVLLLVGSFFWFSNQLSHVGTPVDPNDARQAGMLTPEVLRRNLAGASDSLLDRVRRGEIDDAEYKELMAKAAQTLLSQVDIAQIPPNKAWEYGEVYITARRWPDAKKALEIAVKAAKNEDRRVNDNLRLARVLAETGDVDGAIKTARSVFDTDDKAAAPILPATLLEIVPAAEGKKKDAGLARLLEEAIKCEMRTIIDPETQPGKDFLFARPFHIRRAWEKVVELYVKAGMDSEAQAAQKRAEAMTSTQIGA